MAQFADGVNPDLSLLQPGDDEFLQELLGSEGTDPWPANPGGWPSLPPLEREQSSASPVHTGSGDVDEQQRDLAGQAHGFDQQLQSPRNGGGGDDGGGPKSARQRRLEINRRSQTLYRERQKEKARRMETANMALSSRVSELEAAHAQLLAHKTSLTEQLRATTAQLTSALEGIKGPCSKCGGKGRSSSGGSASPSRGEAPRKAHGPANLGPEELQLYVDFLTAVRGVAVSEEEVRSMSAAAIKNVDQEYVAAAAPLLFQGGEVEGTPAWQRLKLMAQYYWQVGLMFWADRNGVLRVLLEDWEEQLIGERGPPDRQTWRNAAAVMQLSDEQKRGILAAWRVCMDQSRRVLQQREVALAELDMRGMSLQREGDFSLEMRKQGDAADGLQRCWDQANSIMGNFHVAVRNEGKITPVQLAKGCIAVAPWYLDLLALADVVVEEMGETDATIRLMPGMDWHSHPSLLPPASSVL